MSIQSRFRVSLLANLCLIGLTLSLLLGGNPREQSASQISSTASDAAQEARERPEGKSNGPLLDQTKDALFSWEWFDQKDLAAYIGQLREVACPFQTICDIVIGTINRHYAPRIQALRSTAPPFWKTSRRPSPGEIEARRKRLEEAGSLERERDDLVRKLLGVNFRDFVMPYLGRDEPWKEILSFLPDSERKGQVQGVLARYDDLERAVIQASGGTLGLNDQVALKDLYRKKVEELRGVLSPGELDEFQVRTSPVGDELRNRLLVGFEPTEEKFRAIFRVYNAVDRFVAGQPGSAQEHSTSFAGIAVRDQKIRETLGDQRYADYVRSQDQVFQRMVETADYLGLPTTAALQVYNTREQVLTKVRELNAMPGISEVQRTSALNAIRLETEREVVTALGPDGFRRYSGAPWGWWIQEITR